VSGRGAGRLRALLRALLITLALTVLIACARPYQVGDHVLVEWGEEKSLYPAFILERKSKSIYRVHFEGYPSRWDEDVSLPRIKGRVEGPVTQPPPPAFVQRSQGRDKAAEGGVIGRYEVGDQLRVTWRGSTYRASVLEVVSPTEFLIHYEGHESAWDEVVPVARIVTTP